MKWETKENLKVLDVNKNMNMTLLQCVFYYTSDFQIFWLYLLPFLQLAVPPIYQLSLLRPVTFSCHRRSVGSNSSSRMKPKTVSIWSSVIWKKSVFFDLENGTMARSVRTTTRTICWFNDTNCAWNKHTFTYKETWDFRCRFVKERSLLWSPLLSCP